MDKDKSKASFLVSESMLIVRMKIQSQDSLYLLDELKTIVEHVEGEDRFIPVCSLPLVEDPSNPIDGIQVISSTLRTFFFNARDENLPAEFLDVQFTGKSQENWLSVPFGYPGIYFKVPDDASVLDGSYVLQASTGRVFSVSSLEDDFNNAFVGGSLRDGSDRYKWLDITNKIPVPSISLHRGPTDLLLKGLKFAVKDTIDIAGLETGSGSKCYRGLYSPRDETAACVKRLTDAGAVLLGKLRCCQFGDGQDPLERLEEVTPTNPRGDGFQKPSGSSSGSAAACASYGWLDFTVGTDTGGSVRHPAAVNGVYGIRPSCGAMESAGLVAADVFDTPGVFARSARLAEVVCNVMLRDELRAYPDYKKLRYRLIYAVEPEDAEPTDAPKFFARKQTSRQEPTPAEQIMEKFVAALENYLGCTRQEVCIFDLWKDTHPEGTSDDLTEATGDMYKNIVYNQLSQNVIEPFRREYVARHGKMPFIEQSTSKRLAYGASVSGPEMQASFKALEAFSGWINDVLLPRPSSDADDGVVPILVYPQTWGKPSYRDDLGRLATGKVFWDGFSAYSLAYASGCPDFTLPLGEVEFDSKITGTAECLPVAISIMAPRDMDRLLLAVIGDLEFQGVLREVSCGSSLWNKSKPSE
ncbi:hypothetical protein LQW54_005395 [Pestalotiopsis sp. IQ-011]